jgi:hypothetical protein
MCLCLYRWDCSVPDVCVCVEINLAGSLFQSAASPCRRAGLLTSRIDDDDDDDDDDIMNGERANQILHI